MTSCYIRSPPGPQLHQNMLGTYKATSDQKLMSLRALSSICRNKEYDSVVAFVDFIHKDNCPLSIFDHPLVHSNIKICWVHTDIQIIKQNNYFHPQGKFLLHFKHFDSFCYYTIHQSMEGIYHLSLRL